MAAAAARAAAGTAAAAVAAAAVAAAAVAAAAAAATTAAVAAAPGRGDVEQHGRDGSFRSSVRIIGLEQLEDAVRGNEKPADEPEPQNQSGESGGGTGASGSEDLARQSS